MDLAQVNNLLAYLQRLYAEHFPAPTEAMIGVWHDELAALSREEMHQALKRWMRQHRHDYAPKLQSLLDMVEFNRQEEREREDLRRQTQHRNTAPSSYVDVLAQAAERAGSAWAHGHVQLVLRGLGAHKPEETAVQCEAFALQYPEDAADWYAEAAWWREGGHGRPMLSATLGMMYTPKPYTPPVEVYNDAPF